MLSLSSKSFFRALVLPCALLAASAVSHAVDLSVTPEFGTTGAGAHLELKLRPDFSVRFGAGHLEWKTQGQTANLAYDLRLRTQTVDALVDWYPSSDSGFRITGGLAINNSGIDGVARSNAGGSYVLNGNVYDAASAGRVEARMDFRRIAPYFGVGWAKPTQRGWSFSTDVGVLAQGAPSVSLASRGCTASAQTCTQLASDVARETRALAAEVGRYKVYPVLRVGAVYRF